jgi:nucleotide-binding universal stress UspA family protein
MHTYLIVANQTLASRALADAIRTRVDSGPAAFHVVVPATPIPHRLTWDEGESVAAAQERLDAILARLHGLGAGATGEIGAPDPVSAALDALRDHEDVEEVILSTLPAGISRWLGQDVPSRLRSATTVPVMVVTEVPQETPTATG